MLQRFFISVAISFVLLSCSSEVEDKDRIVGNNEFSIVIPDYLQESDNVSSDGLIQYFVKEHDCFMYLVVFKDVKSDYDQGFGLINFYEYIANDILNNYLDYGRLTPPTDTIINGISAKQFYINGSLKIYEGDNSVLFHETIFETDSVFYEIRSWCCYIGKNRYLNDMKKIAASFKFK
ncbi:MAG: hypothetical protein JXR58_10970 [Bacteroidales bacterium]|nr:hypothetical protein [Bacteroidales bacterium]